MFGSPGLDADQRSDLKVPEGHLYSEWADRDSVPHLNIAHHFGNSPYPGDPSALQDVQRLSTDTAVGVGGQPLAATHEHGEYLTDNSTSQYNMAAVVAGKPDLVVGYQPPPLPPPPPPGSPVAAPPGAVPTPPPLPPPPR